jgi:hypothetical protein
MGKLALATVIIALAAACKKEWKPLDASVLAKRPAHTIGVVGTKPASFSETTPGEAATGLVGRAIGSGVGQQIVEENHIVDPSLSIANRLLVALAARHSLTAQTPRLISAPDEPVRWDTDLYLQVRTEEWGIIYLPGDLFHYCLYYEASIELHDGRSQDLLASGQCRGRRPRDSKVAPTYDQALDRHARFVKQSLQDVAASCAEKFSRELFSIELPKERPPAPFPVDPQAIRGACHLEETPAWKAADSSERQRLLEECWNQRTNEILQTPPPAPTP